MHKLVPKRTIKRMEDTAETEECRSMKQTLALASESDDEMFREWMLLYLDDRRILNSEDGEKIKRDFDRMSRGI